MRYRETWKPVAGYEGYYEVSDAGRVRSIRTNFGNPRIRGLRQSTTHDGYRRVCLSKDNKKRHAHVAHLVLEAFVGPRPAGMQACHGPAGKTQNSLSNLRWDTPEANYQDRARDGNVKAGDSHPMAKITTAVARKVKQSPSSLTARQVAEKLGVSIHTVRMIRQGRIWRKA